MTSSARVEGVQMCPDGRMDSRNAATYVGLSVKTLAMKRCDGTGPEYVKVGKIFYFKDDLDKWLKAKRVSNNPHTKENFDG